MSTPLLERDTRVRCPRPPAGKRFGRPRVGNTPVRNQAAHENGGTDMYIGGGVLALIIVLLLLIWLF
jgi:hypothetical protein